MIKRLLIANRGEIACRIIKTARQLGITCIAVYSDADATSAFVALADEAFRLGPAPSKESYLRGDLILALAEQATACAIHPGYGFLSENADFAEACAAKGILFVGPSPDSIRKMGRKDEAKRLVQAVGVPTLPGYAGDEQTLAAFQKAAKTVGYPVLLKPVAGGGGKGMHVVASEKELAEAMNSAQREALSSFGDATLLLEKYLVNPRHIEVQVFGDTQGQVIHLFERDCSIQRRQQKILEEAPAVGLTDTLRTRLRETAIAAAKAIHYVGAGTIEFLVADDECYFMEMNTRLQVEHPVTEKITGLDLVEWQLRIAVGEPLPITQSILNAQGHAIEARLCAEDPDNDFLPATGTIHYLALPSTTNVRIDSGIHSHDTISLYYDSLLAKVIAYGETRLDALQHLLQALQAYHLVGVKTNKRFLTHILQHPDYIAGKIHTGFIPQHHTTLMAQKTTLTPEVIGALILYTALIQENKNPIPWNAYAWQMNAAAISTIDFLNLDNQLTSIAYEKAGSYFSWQYQANFYHAYGSLNDHNQLTLCLNDHHFTATLIETEKSWTILTKENEVTLQKPLMQWESQATLTGSLSAPMPGNVTALLVEPGKTVKRGDPLMIIEAMKMEHTIRAPHDGVVKTLLYRVGDQVQEGAALLVLA